MAAPDGRDLSSTPFTPFGRLMDALQIALLISEAVGRMRDLPDECGHLVEAVQQAALAAHSFRCVLEGTDRELALLQEAIDATIHECDQPTDDLLALQARIHVLTGESMSSTKTSADEGGGAQ
jgi:hypothetical protein